MEYRFRKMGNIKIRGRKKWGTSAKKNGENLSGERKHFSYSN